MNDYYTIYFCQYTLSFLLFWNFIWS